MCRKPSFRSILSLVLILVVSGSLFAAGEAETESGEPSSEESFPSEPIEMVVHAGVGGGADIFTRTISQPASEILGVDLEVVNKIGGVGAVALEYVDRQPADGYTVFALLPGHLMTIARGNAPLALEDITPLVRGAVEWNTLLVRTDSEFQTIEDLIEEGKRRPITFGGAHIGAIDHIAVFLFADRAGLMDPNYVPFDSGAAVQAAVVSGDIEVAVSNLSVAETAIRNGDIMPIVVMGEDRLEEAPDVPTTFELGINAKSAVVRGLGILSDTPEDRIETLEQAFLEAMDSSSYRAYLEGSGMGEDSIAGTEEWSEHVQQIYTDSVEVLTALGMIE